jgi:hypothetical protein
MLVVVEEVTIHQQVVMFIQTPPLLLADLVETMGQEILHQQVHLKEIMVELQVDLDVVQVAEVELVELVLLVDQELMVDLGWQFLDLPLHLFHLLYLDQYNQLGYLLLDLLDYMLVVVDPLATSVMEQLQEMVDLVVVVMQEDQQVLRELPIQVVVVEHLEDLQLMLLVELELLLLDILYKV